MKLSDKIKQLRDELIENGTYDELDDQVDAFNRCIEHAEDMEQQLSSEVQH